MQRMPALRRWWLLPLLIAACGVMFGQGVEKDASPSGSSATSAQMPTIAAHVTDLTGTLSSAQQAALERKLTEYEQRKGSQVVVVLVPTAEPDGVDQYAVRLFEKAKLGRGKQNGKWLDDGVLLLVAKNDKRMRIEVGYGFEGVLTDLVSKRIIDESISPLFRQGDFNAGINAGVDQILRVIGGEALPEPDHRWRGGTQQIGNSLPFLIFFVFAASSVLRGILGRGGGALATGAVTGVIAFLLSRVIPIALFAGGIGLVFALMAGAAGGSGWSSRGGRGGFGGGWGGGLGGGGFGGGFGGGGGGFGGGGGRSGGGGASGGW